MSCTQAEKVELRQKQLAEHGYIAERNLASALELFHNLQRPLLLEGDAGVGKTEIASTFAAMLDTKLIRLQCYEGLDLHNAVYEWNYQHQLLAIQARNQASDPYSEEDMFSERYLLKRPLLQAISEAKPAVLLIDEIDRADEEFEAFLLEVLSDFQISIPELGTLKAVTRPHVILTSNGSRELSDALRRRCLYFYVDYPSFDKELQIVSSRLPHLDSQLARQVVSFVQELRRDDLRKTPGIAETLDWASALMNMGLKSLDTDLELLADSLMCLLKTHEDMALLQTPELHRRVQRAL